MKQNESVKLVRFCLIFQLTQSLKNSLIGMLRIDFQLS